MFFTPRELPVSIAVVAHNQINIQFFSTMHI